MVLLTALTVNGSLSLGVSLSTWALSHTWALSFLGRGSLGVIPSVCRWWVPPTPHQQEVQPCGLSTLSLSLRRPYLVRSTVGAHQQIPTVNRITPDIRRFLVFLQRTLSRRRECSLVSAETVLNSTGVVYPIMDSISRGKQAVFSFSFDVTRKQTGDAATGGVSPPSIMSCSSARPIRGRSRPSPRFMPWENLSCPTESREYRVSPARHSLPDGCACRKAQHRIRVVTAEIRPGFAER